MELLNIQYTDDQALKDGYRSLSRNGEINVFSSVKEMSEALRAMESAGFAGIEVTFFNTASETVNIRGYKGKSGPCYNTGRVVTYKGAALAAIDDDSHILFADEETPVCEKTAAIYKLPAYNKVINCREADPELIAKLEDSPEIFICDSFEADHEKLFRMVEEPEVTEAQLNLFYPGPFRLLILHDGRVIKRGYVTSIPKTEASNLIKSDGLFKLENIKPENPLFFKEIYGSYGTRCFLDYQGEIKVSESEAIIDLTTLDKISDELKELLLKTIYLNKKYFILTGSDSGDKFGCCPSEVVTEANGLKKAGILDSSPQSSASDSCLVTIYAFRNEIRIIDNDLQFNTDNDFRLLILDKLQNKTNLKLKQTAKWILLGFIIITLIIAFLKIKGPSSPVSNLSLYELLDPGSKDMPVVILFHYSERCNICLNMEKYINDVLIEDFSEQVNSNKIQFKLITIDIPENKNLIERFNLVSPTIILVQFESGEEKNIKILNEAWELSQEEEMFKNMLAKELNMFYNINNE